MAAAQQSHMPRWQVGRPGSFRWREWDNESVLYDIDSGDTHFLNALGRQALECLVHTAMNEGELASQLARDIGGTPTSELLRNVGQLLARFYELGLVEPVPDEVGGRADDLRTRE